MGFCNYLSLLRPPFRFLLLVLCPAFISGGSLSNRPVGFVFRNRGTYQQRTPPLLPLLLVRRTPPVFCIRSPPGWAFPCKVRRNVHAGQSQSSFPGSGAFAIFSRNWLAFPYAFNASMATSAKIQSFVFILGVDTVAVNQCRQFPVKLFFSFIALLFLGFYILGNGKSPHLLFRFERFAINRSCLRPHTRNWNNRRNLYSVRVGASAYN